MLFRSVHWSYEDLPPLACNGIRIVKPLRPDEGGYHNNKDDRPKETWSANLFHVPTVSVFDPNGALPLTLTREKLSSDHLPFDTILRENVIRDFLAYCIVSAPTSPLVEIGKKALSPFVAYPGFSDERESDWGYHRRGWGPEIGRAHV